MSALLYSLFCLPSFRPSHLNCNCVSALHFDIQMRLTGKGWTWHLCLAFRPYNFSHLLTVTLPLPSLSVSAQSPFISPFRLHLCLSQPTLSHHHGHTLSVTLYSFKLPLFFPFHPYTSSQSSLQLQLHIPVCIFISAFHDIFYSVYSALSLATPVPSFSLSLYIALYAIVLGFNLINLAFFSFCLSTHCVFQLNSNTCRFHWFVKKAHVAKDISWWYNIAH